MSDWLTWLPQMLPGLRVSILLTALCLALGLPLGLVLALAVQTRSRLVRVVALVVVEIGRGLPALVLLYLLYFGLPEVGVTLSAFVTAVISLAWTTGAYSSELFRSGLGAVPHGQREAAAVCGLTGWTAMRHVILPQALRISVPPLSGLSVTIFQASSLAFVIAVPELMSRAYAVGSTSFRYLSVFALTAVLYGLVTVAALALVGLLERRLSRHL